MSHSVEIPQLLIQSLVFSYDDRKEVVTNGFTLWFCFIWPEQGVFLLYTRHLSLLFKNIYLLLKNKICSLQECCSYRWTIKLLTLCLPAEIHCGLIFPVFSNNTVNLHSSRSLELFRIPGWKAAHLEGCLFSLWPGRMFTGLNIDKCQRPRLGKGSTRDNCS